MSTERQEIQETFSVPSPARLKLENVRGTVDIQAGEPGSLSVTAVKHLDNAHPERTHIEMFQAEDGQVTVATRFGVNDWARGLGFGRGKPCRVDYTVRLPRDCELDVSVVDSDVTAAGLEGAFRLHTVSGNLRLSDLAGVLDLNSVSGDVAGARLRASEPVRLRTVSGDITLVDCELPGADGNSVSGDINLSLRLGAGPYRFKTVSGNVRLDAQAGSGTAHAELSSLSGDLHTNLPLQYRRSGPGHVKAAAGTPGAGPEVKLNSVSGDLWLAVNGQSEATDASAEAAAQRGDATGAATVNRAEILERVARGEMSVDEAAAALKA